MHGSSTGRVRTRRWRGPGSPACLALALLVALAALPAAAQVSRRPLFDLDGREVDPFQGRDAKVMVFLFVRTDCTISNRYAPEMRRLFEKFAKRQVAFWLVYPDPGDSVAMIREHVAEYGYPGAVLRDPQHTLVGLTGATVTPEVAVFAGAERMVYRGRIDDRYGDLGRARPAPTTRDLENALEAALAGKPLPHPTTPAVGCFIADLK